MSDNADAPADEAQPEEKPKKCRIKGCDAPGKHPGTGFCAEHLRRYRNAQRAGTAV